VDRYKAELAAAKRRTELNAAAKKLQLAKAELKRLEAEAAGLAVVPAGRAFPEHLVLFVDLETRLLEMVDHPSQLAAAGHRPARVP
jgi:hypothetical protein